MGLEDSPQTENPNNPAFPRSSSSEVQIQSGRSDSPQLFDPLETFRESSQIQDLQKGTPFKSTMSAPNGHFSNENVQEIESETLQNPPPLCRGPENVLNQAGVRCPNSRTNMTNNPNNNMCNELRRILAAGPVQPQHLPVRTSSGTSQPQHIGLPICQTPNFQKVVLSHQLQPPQRPHLPHEPRSLPVVPNGHCSFVGGGIHRPRFPPPQLHSQQNPMMFEPRNCNPMMNGFGPFVPRAEHQVGFDQIAPHIQALERKVAELSARLNECNRERLHFQHQIIYLGAQKTFSERQTQDMATQKNEEMSRLREQVRNMDARRSFWKQKCRQAELKVQSQQIKIDSLTQGEKQLQEEVTKLSEQCGEFMYLKHLLEMKNQEFHGMMIENLKIGGELQKKSDLLKKYHQNASTQFKTFMKMAKSAYINNQKRIFSNDAEVENENTVPMGGPVTKRERLDQGVNCAGHTAQNDVNVEPMNLILNDGHNHSRQRAANNNEREEIVSHFMVQNDNGRMSDMGLGLLAQVAGMAQPAAAAPVNNNEMIIIDNNLHYDNEVVINNLAWNAQNGDMNSQESHDTDYESEV